MFMLHFFLQNIVLFGAFLKFCNVKYTLKQNVEKKPVNFCCDDVKYISCYELIYLQILNEIH